MDEDLEGCETSSLMARSTIAGQRGLSNFRSRKFAKREELAEEPKGGKPASDGIVLFTRRGYRGFL